MSSIQDLTYDPIALAAAQNETTLVAAVAGTSVVAEHVTVIPSAAGTFAIWSGTVAAGVRLTGDIVGTAGTPYRLGPFRARVGEILNLNRVTNFAVAGNVAWKRA